MTTRNTVEEYFGALSRGERWQAFLSDTLTFTSHTNPTKEVTGRDAYVESTRRFYAMISSLELRQLLVDGDRACASTRYVLHPPAGEPFTCDVAEFFTVNDGSIDALEIFFDSAPFPA
jgi:ketosteroid isomerase-like protein